MAYGRKTNADGSARIELEDQMVLVFDWGGGTLDVSLIEITD